MKRVLIALLAVGLVAAACSGDSGEEEGAVKYGFLNGQSGDYGPWGGWALAAAEVAVEELNAAGGVLGAVKWSWSWRTTGPRPRAQCQASPS